MFQINSNFLKIQALALATFCGLSARADFQISPSVGYQSYTLKLTDMHDIPSETKIQNPVLGLKLGVVSASGIGFALAGSYAKGRASSKTQGLEGESEYHHKMASAQLSVAAMNVFKIYLGYILVNEMKLTDALTTVETSFRGPGFQAGMAFNLTRSLDLAFQYDIHQFNEVKVGSGDYRDVKSTYRTIDSGSASAHLVLNF